MLSSTNKLSQHRHVFYLILGIGGVIFSMNLYCTGSAVSHRVRSGYGDRALLPSFGGKAPPARKLCAGVVVLSFLSLLSLLLYLAFARLFDEFTALAKKSPQLLSRSRNFSTPRQFFCVISRKTFRGDLPYFWKTFRNPSWTFSEASPVRFPPNSLSLPACFVTFVPFAGGRACRDGHRDY